MAEVTDCRPAYMHLKALNKSIDFTFGGVAKRLTTVLLVAGSITAQDKYCLAINRVRI